MDLVAEMMQSAKKYCTQLGRNPETEMELHFHRPLVTRIKHLHMHVLLGRVSLKGRIVFSRCLSTDPKRFLIARRGKED